MSKGDDKKEMWRGDAGYEIFLKWAERTGHERKNILNPESTRVDNRGLVDKEIYTPFSDDGYLFSKRHDRGWGEALNYSYGRFLSVFQAALINDWQSNILNFELISKGNINLPYVSILNEFVDKPLGTKEKENEQTLTQKELDHFNRFLFPLHVFGYNWLADNAESASKLVEYIDKVINLYSCYGYGLAVEKVILVTHSMGGLVARYAMNPTLESTFEGCQNKVLGVVHGVIPDLGSPAAYRRMGTGASEEGYTAGRILGWSAKELMPVLAQSPAPLQLLPYPSYKSPWLSIPEEGSYPQTKDPQTGKPDPFKDIYLRNDVWWKLYKPDILDKENKVVDNNWKNYVKMMEIKVRQFMYHQESKLYHPNTYVFYGDQVDSDGSLEWVPTKLTVSPYVFSQGESHLPPTNRQKRETGQLAKEFKLNSSKTAGDGTVPIESFSTIYSHPSIKSILATNVDHQDAYKVDDVADIKKRPAIQFTLRAIIKMVKDVPLND
ncbi:PGAP1 family protein [Moellerella wisconsensis ATCC 35017]|uniref:PGAP1 family protein n=2 Tax=Moellerella wisconsensis TaxID=158849 RepID=A0A0N0ZAS0_9GAMM|nr:PGAP1 family protein [Moellerella wisconsensis ATCC 35017]